MHETSVWSASASSSFCSDSHGKIRVLGQRKKDVRRGMPTPARTRRIAGSGEPQRDERFLVTRGKVPGDLYEPMAESEPQTIKVRRQDNGLETGAAEAACDFHRFEEQLLAVPPSAVLRQYPGDDRERCPPRRGA